MLSWSAIVSKGSNTQRSNAQSQKHLWSTPKDLSILSRRFLALWKWDISLPSGHLTYSHMWPIEDRYHGHLEIVIFFFFLLRRRIIKIHLPEPLHLDIVEHNDQLEFINGKKEKKTWRKLMNTLWVGRGLNHSDWRWYSGDDPDDNKVDDVPTRLNHPFLASPWTYMP